MKSLNIEEMTTTYGGSAATYKSGMSAGTKVRHWLEEAKLAYMLDRFGAYLIFGL